MSFDFNALAVFSMVAEERSFRAAADRLGVTRSAVSQTIRKLEETLGIALVSRTTRSVSLTEAGERLFGEIAPALAEMRGAVDAAGHLAGQPRGQLRLAVSSIAESFLSGPLLASFLDGNPEVKLHVTVTDEEFDIVAEGYDAGVRLGEVIAQDMIAVPIGPRSQRFAAVASKDYLDRRGRPSHPRELVEHACIRNRFASGSMPGWEFERGEETVLVDPPAALIVQTGGGVDLAVDCAIAGSGIVFLFEDWLRPHLEAGRVEPVLEDWWPTFPGPFLYYPGRRLVPAPLRAFIDFVRAA